MQMPRMPWYNVGRSGCTENCYLERLLDASVGQGQTQPQPPQKEETHCTCNVESLYPSKTSSSLICHTNGILSTVWNSLAQLTDILAWTLTMRDQRHTHTHKHMNCKRKDANTNFQPVSRNGHADLLDNLDTLWASLTSMIFQNV